MKRIYLFFFASLLAWRSTLFSVGTSYTWTNGTANATWNDSGNWTPTSGPGVTFPSVTDDVANFTIAPPPLGLVGFTQNISVGTINFDNSGEYFLFSSPVDYTLTFSTSSGNPLINAINGTHMLNSNLFLSFPSAIDINSASPQSNGTVEIGQLNPGGALILNVARGTAAQDLLIDQISSGPLTFAGTGVSKFTSGGPGSIPAVDITVTSGSLEIAASSMQNSNVVINSPGTMIFSGPSSIQAVKSLSGSGTLTLNGNSFFVLQNAGGTTTFSGTITGSGNLFTHSSNIASTLVLSGASSNTYSGTFQINGPGGLELNKSGGAIAIPGNLTFITTSGGSVLLDADNQLASSSIVTFNSGSTGVLNLNDHNQTIGTLASSGAGAQIMTGSGAGGTLTTNSSSDSTFAGVISGNGGFSKGGSGNLALTGTSAYAGATTVTGGRLSVNGSITSGGVTINSGATLGGIGTVTATGLNVIAINGTLSPGNSIGTINLTGPVNFGPGSTLEIEITPDPLVRDFVNVTGNVTISGSGTTLLVEPQPGVYPNPFSTEILAATSITGKFATLTTTLPTFALEADYSSTEIILTKLTSLPFSTVVTSGNAGAVAICLDAAAPAAGSDMAFVQAELRFISTTEELAQTLAMMQPSQFTALALAQEETTLYANGTIFQRLRQNTEICPLPCQENVSKSKKPVETCKEEKKLGFWVSPFGGFAYQRKQRGQAGFNAATGGVVAGADYTFAHHWTLGGAVGYSYDHLKWKEGAGYANIQDGYGALYASFMSKYAYALGSMICSYNHYNTARNIEIGDGLVMPIDRTAKASHNGYQTSGHLQAGLLFGKKVQFAPFGEIDYIFVHEANFNERGAKSLDLHVQKKLSDLLQGEAGFEISRCFSMSKNKVSPSIGFSVIQEWRFLGKRYKSSFSGTSCVMHTKGMNPDRTLFSSECGLTFLLPDENQTLSLDYKGKWGEHFQDNRVMAQFLMRF